MVYEDAFGPDVSLRYTPILSGIKEDAYQYYKYGASMPETTRIRQMWRIKYLGDGFYSVRPLNKLDMGLNVTDRNIDIYNLGTSDTLADTPSSERWTIVRDTLGYVFQNNGESGKTMQVEEASEIWGTTVIASPQVPSTNCRWGLTRITEVPTGIYLYSLSSNSVISGACVYFTPGESRSLSDMSLKAVAYDEARIDPVIFWGVSDYALATVSTRGTVTGKAPGTVTVTAGMSGNMYEEASYTLVITQIPNGTYYLQNKQTGYYADIEGPTMAAGITIHQWKFHGGNSQRWVFEHLGDGYYSIRSNNASSAFYLGVIDDSTGLDVDIVLRSGALTDGMKWKIEKTVNGAYKIIPKTGESKGYILATTTSDRTNGAKLIQGAYIDNNSYRDEWNFYTHHDYTLMYIGDKVGDPSMPDILNAVGSSLRDNAWMEGYEYTALTKEELLVHLSSTSIFSCITHGYQTKIATSDGFLTVSDINSLGDDAFNSLRFVYFGACYTGEGWEGANNLVNAVYNKGADAVLGFVHKTEVEETNIWTEAFMISLSKGSTLQDAMGDADIIVRKKLWNRDYFSTASDYRYLLGSDQIIPCR